MEMVLSFNQVQFDVVDRNGEPWVRVSQIATALEYASAQRVIELFTRHADEFSDSMTALVKLPTEGGEQEVRIFSLRGCHLLAIFARTPVAKEFRKWVLDVLDHLGDKQPSASSPLPPSDQNTIQTLVKVIADRYPPEEQKSIYMQVWMRFRNHFRLGSYKDLPQSKMAEAVAYLANLKVSEKNGQPKLPSAYTPLAEAGKEAMGHIMDLRRDLSATSIELMEIMQRATHHGRYLSLNEHQKALGAELGQSVGAFFMCINHNMIAVEHMFRAFCEAEKMIFG